MFNLSEKDWRQHLLQARAHKCCVGSRRLRCVDSRRRQSASGLHQRCVGAASALRRCCISAASMLRRCCVGSHLDVSKQRGNPVKRNCLIEKCHLTRKHGVSARERTSVWFCVCILAHARLARIKRAAARERTRSRDRRHATRRARNTNAPAIFVERIQTRSSS